MNMKTPGEHMTADSQITAVRQKRAKRGGPRYLLAIIGTFPICKPMTTPYAIGINQSADSPPVDVSS
jgi:hypothetical protein